VFLARGAAHDVSPTRGHGSLWLTLYYCFPESYSHVQSSFAALPFSSGSNAPLNGAAASALFSKGSHDHQVHSSCDPSNSVGEGSESCSEESGEQPQGFAERCFRVGFRCRKRDDLASRRTRSAAAFALPHGYRTPEGSLPNVALRTLTSL
jgi:hypothetical protein